MHTQSFLNVSTLHNITVIIKVYFTFTEEYPLKYNEGFIATAGRYGSSVGKLHLQIDSETGVVTLKDKQLIDTVNPDNREWSIMIIYVALLYLFIIFLYLSL